MLTYLEERGHISFEAMPLNDVDLLVFAQLAYIDMRLPGAGGREKLARLLERAEFARESAIDATQERFGFQIKHDARLAALAAKAERYADIRVIEARGDYSPEREKQFAMIALTLPGGDMLIAYRGTDNTLAGWKEDCNLAFDTPVPAQLTALAALTELAARVQGRIRLCGHSKGGNLAFYASAFAPEDVQARISDVVSFDGPGLTLADTQTPGYARVRDKLRVIMPRASIVGLLFERPDNVRYIHSRAISLMQHYPYNWKVQNADFITAPGLSPDARYLGRTMQTFLSKLTRDEKRDIACAIYRVLRANNAETIQDLLRGYIRNTPAILRAILKEDKRTYKLAARAWLAFWRSALQALTERA